MVVVVENIGMCASLSEVDRMKEMGEGFVNYFLHLSKPMDC